MSRASLRGYFSRSAGSPNWRGLTKIETTVVAFSARARCDQRPMALVQPAHRRHEADGSRRGGERLAQLGPGADDPQHARAAQRAVIPG